MAYHSRPRHQVLPQFRGTASTRQSPEQRERLLSFCAEQYQAGRSIHELAELTGRTQAAVRRALDQAGVVRRGRGAYLLSKRASEDLPADVAGEPTHDEDAHRD